MVTEEYILSYFLIGILWKQQMTIGCICNGTFIDHLSDY
jgi:hypothetical protein